MSSPLPKAEPTSLQSFTRFLKTLVDATRWRLVGNFLLMLLASVTQGLGLLVLIPMMQVVGFDVGQGSIGQIATYTQRAFEALGLAPTIEVVIGAFLLVLTLNALLARFQAVANTRLYESFAVHLRQKFYAAISNAQWLFFARQKSSTLLHMLTVELSRASAATSSLLSLAVRSTTTVVYFALAFFLSPLMTLLVLGFGLTLSMLLLRKTQAARTKGDAVSDAYESLYHTISEYLSSMKITKSHGAEAIQVSRFNEQVAHAADRQLDVVENQADVGFWMQLGTGVMLASTLYIALVYLALPVATVLVLLLLFMRLVPMVMSVQRGYQTLISNLPAFDRVMRMQDACLAAAELHVENAASVPFERSLALDGVSFSYGDGAESIVLDQVDMLLRAGETTAVVGPSGAGKSTLADLLIGLVTPQEGRILIDGVPLTGARLEAWRSQIAYVPQDTFLFHDTARANLLAFAPGASDESIREALANAAADFVYALPQGLETVLGDRGVRLSGGEKQRLSLARALLRRPSLLVLDEATSALDIENEKRIQEAIDRLQGKVTILVVAHRLSTIRNADLIHVLEQGALVESGDWETLVNTPAGRFRGLCQAQGLLGEEPAPVASY